MKRVAKVLGLLLLLLVIGIAVFIFYQRKNAFNTLIPVQTATLIKVDVYQVGKILLLDRWQHGKSKKRGERADLSGISIPAFLFLFQLEKSQSTSLFTTLKLNNASKFEASLKKFTRWETAAVDAPKGIKVVSKARVVVAFNEHKVAVAFGKNAMADLPLLFQVLSEKDVITVSNSRFKEDISQSATVVVVNENGSGSINFNKGKIDAFGNFTSAGMETPQKISPPVSNLQNPLTVWYQGNFEKWLQGKTFKLGDSLTLHGDSLLQAGIKGVALSVEPNPIQQTDTVISYEYNDDFEKVATSKVNVLEVPNIKCKFLFDNAPLRYLRSQHLVTDSSLNKSIFPLYKMQMFDDGKSVSFSTDAVQRTKENGQSSKYFFYLYLNAQQLSKLSPFAAFKPILKSIETVEAKASKRTEQSNEINLAVAFTDKKRNALAIIMTLLNQSL